MALSANIIRGGFSAGQAKALNGAVATGLTAAGTVIGDAFDLTADMNIIGTCAAGAGVQLPACELGDSLWVYNGGANSCNVYPSASSQINQIAVGGAHILAANTAALYERITTTRWVAMQSA
jgi:hypothetical protein